MDNLYSLHLASKADIEQFYMTLTGTRFEIISLLAPPKTHNTLKIPTQHGSNGEMPNFPPN
jgi:hypothetical protein